MSPLRTARITDFVDFDICACCSPYPASLGTCSWTVFGLSLQQSKVYWRIVTASLIVPKTNAYLPMNSAVSHL
jgi:hypothetical protein